MKTLLRMSSFFVAVALPLAVFAADEKPAPVDVTPPQDAKTYPCWEHMQDGHMGYMRGNMMNGSIHPTPPKDAKVYTCWDAMHGGKTMPMHGHMMWGDGMMMQGSPMGTGSAPAAKK